MTTNLTHLFSLFNFKACEYVVLYIILLEVASELSRFCKMAGRLIVGPRCCRYCKIRLVHGSLFLSCSFHGN